MREAAAFTRSPLGIVGLFISLVYGIAGLVAGFSGSLDAHQRWPLVVFVFVFPFVMLYVFVDLVKNHHHKLYSPRDWNDESNVFGSASKSEKDEERERDISDVLVDERTSLESSGLEEDLAIREEIAGRIERIEHMVMTMIASEFDIPVGRNVALGDGIRFDGLIQGYGLDVLIEVKVVRGKEAAHRWLDDFRSVIERAGEYLAQLATPVQARFLLVLVSLEELVPGELVGEVQTQLRGWKTGLSVEVRVYTEAELESWHGRQRGFS